MDDQPTADIPTPGRPPQTRQDAGDVTRTFSPIDGTVAPNDVPAPSDQAPGIPDLSVGPAGTTAGSRSAPEPPKLDGYNVVQAIGEGGMGTVWRGVQLSTRRNVALKLISAAGFASERARQRFDREVEITARLEHPNIARVYDSGINHGVYFYAMELIDGMPLDQFVAEHHLDRVEILRLFAIVCRGVQHAHEHGVIHRDLKPGNILVTADGQPHVLDFGLAKALEQAGKEAGISIDGEVAGTPGFMSPEQAAGKLDIDARCDVFSLGVILYRLLTGGTPHDLSGTYLDVLRRVSEEEPKRPRAVDKTMDRELEALLLRAIQRDPAHRYRNAGQLAQDIENYLAGDPITARPPTTIYYLRKRVHKHRVKLATFGIVVLLVGVAATLTIWLIHSHHATSVLEKTASIEARDKLVTAAKAAVFKADGIRSDIAKGDASATAAGRAEALRVYTSAVSDFDKAQAPRQSAELGLWNLEASYPAPIAFIAAANDAFWKVEMTAGPFILQDSRRALAGYQDGTLRLLDLATGRALRTIHTGKNPILSAAASADGAFALIGEDDGLIQQWDLATGALKREFRNPARPLLHRVTHLAISSDGKWVLSVSGATPQTLASPAYNDTLTLWSEGSPVRTTDRDAGLLAVKGTVTQAVFSHGQSFVTGSAQVDVWDADGRHIAGIPDSATAVAFSPDNKFVVSGSSDGTVRRVDLATGKITPSQTHGGAILAIGCDAQWGQIAFVTEDGALGAISPDGTALWKQPPAGYVDAAVMSGDGHLAVTVKAAQPDAGGKPPVDAGISVWRMAPSPAARSLSNAGPFASVSLSGDGRLALARSSGRSFAGEAAGHASLFDGISGKRLRVEGLLNDRFDAAVLSRDGKSLALLAGKSLSLLSLDSPGSDSHFTLAAAPSEPAVLAINRDGSRVAVSTPDNALLIYRRGGSQSPIRAVGHTAAITSAAFSDDGRVLVSGSEDKTVRVWNADSGAAVCTLRGHQASVNAVAISGDGRLAVSGSGSDGFSGENDNSVRIWDIPAAGLLKTFSRNARVRSVAISGNGKFIAAGGDDQIVILCDRESGDVLRSSPANIGSVPSNQPGVDSAAPASRGTVPVLSLGFDDAGQHLLIGSDAAYLWDFYYFDRVQKAKPAVAAILAQDPAQPLDGDSLLTLARWYAMQGQSDWAAMLFADARAHGAEGDAYEMWYCDWERGDSASAIQHEPVALPKDVPDYYYRLCRTSLAVEKQTIR
ncbi:MAG TPA: serine/threonine-protein kinase [Tepidisphaeraceae bacterium]|nr:serine/threonine-protein kinase [Tepidisphaeraceae bacterium]